MTQKIFKDWLDKIIETENPGEDILAYYFGIIETTNGYEIYLTGSKVYDENDEDWACNTDFVPSNKYLKIGLGETEWEQILEHIKTLIKQYKGTPNFKNSWLGKAKAIATGFDGGDLYLIN